MKRKKSFWMSLVVMALVVSFVIELVPLKGIHAEEIADEGTYTITVTTKALKNASLSTKVYVNGTKLKKKGFYVNGKINGVKEDIYYVPAKLFAKALGGKYKANGKNVTITLDSFKVQFTVGKDGYSASVTQGVGALAPLSFGKSYKKGSYVYVPVRLFALFYERIAGATAELTESKKKITFDLTTEEEVVEAETWFLDDRFTKSASAEITSDIQAAFDFAVESYKGGELTPVACLATGEIMGTINYALVCRGADADGNNTFCLIVITSLPTGAATIAKYVPTNFASNIISGPVMGGWSEPESVDIDSTVKAVFDKAMEELVGVDYTPVAVLEKQLVAGMNYCILCEAKGVYPGAQKTYALVYIYADLSGNTEISDIVAFEAAVEE